MPKKKALKQAPRSISLVTKLLILFGGLLVLIPSLFYVNQTIQLAYFTPKVPHITRTLPPPTSISIAAISLELPIEEAGITNNAWGVSNQGASHLAISANPGEQGPIILYAHNTDDRFGPIRWLDTGKEILVTTADKKVHRYVVEKTAVVDPTQTKIFFSRHGETLYLYTCDGFADLKRFVVIALPTRK